MLVRKGDAMINADQIVCLILIECHRFWVNFAYRSHLQIMQMFILRADPRLWSRKRSTAVERVLAVNARNP